MRPVITIEIKGFKEARQRIHELKGAPGIIAAMQAAARHLKGKLNIYPPATEANSPASGHWYQRGYGPKWMTKAGVHGYKTSKILGKSWDTHILEGGMAAEIGTNVTYAPYVHDDKKQAHFHAARGWKTLQQVADSEGEKVQKLVLAAVEKELKRILGMK